MKIVSSSGRGNFKLLDNEKEICELVYKNWFTGMARTRLNSNSLVIKPRNIWTSKVDIIKNDQLIGDITFNLRGRIVLRIESIKGQEQNYLLKNKGNWKFIFEVFNESEELQLTLNSVNRWSKLNYDYTIEIAGYNGDIAVEEFLVYCGYSTNLYLEMISVL